MVALPVFPLMFWNAMPPELNTARLQVGAGAAPMLQASAGWEAFSLLLETQADELAASLVSLSSAWVGGASERAVQATMPMVIWLRMVSLQAMKRSIQAAAQAASHTTAFFATPQLAELAENHITNAVLWGTNFMGVNTAPIGLNEADYDRMWSLAAAVMDAYQAESSANTVFEPIPPATPIVMNGAAEGAVAGSMGVIAASAPMSAMREVAFAHVGAQATAESAGLTSGNVASQGNMAAQRAEGQAQRSQSSTQQPGQTNEVMQQGVQMAGQMASQVGSMVMQLPQQASQPMQQLMAPMQQLTSLFSSSGPDKAQLGFLGTSPLSEHPLVGGSGASSGAGLVRAASVPGAGGTVARTPMMANLVGNTDTTAKPQLGAAAGSNGTGLAPVNAGAGSPGMLGNNKEKKDGGSRPGLQAPSLLPYDTAEEEEDSW